MIRFVLDTDVLTLLQHGHAKLLQRLLAAVPGEVAVTIISVEEQVSGWYSLLRKAKSNSGLAFAYQSLADLVLRLAKHQIVSFTEPAICRFDALKSQHLGVRAMDLRIAAIALEINATVVTRNLRDFQLVPGLKCEDWSS